MNELIKRPVLELPGYIEADGAILLTRKPVLNGEQQTEDGRQLGSIVSPYFANQALIEAHKNGLDIKDITLPWIHWLLENRNANGLIGDYHRQDNDSNHWIQTPESEVMATVQAQLIALLYMMSPAGELSGPWKEAEAVALCFLDKQWNKNLLLFRSTEESGRLSIIGNTDIAEAFHLSRQYAKSKSDLYKDWAFEIKKGFENNFLYANERGFRALPDQPYNPEIFYPDGLAQIWPGKSEFLISSDDAKTRHAEWLKDGHRERWLENAKTDFSNGIIALHAFNMGDMETAKAWFEINKKADIRTSGHCIAMDEVALNVIAQRLKLNLDPIPQKGPKL